MRYEGWEAIYCAVARRLGSKAPIEVAEQDASGLNMEDVVLYAVFETMLSTYGAPKVPFTK